MAVTRLLELKEILGDPRSNPPAPPILPVSRSTFYREIRAGRFPRGVEVSPGRVAWREDDIQRLIARLSNTGRKSEHEENTRRAD
ncbi:helix-turn-helix transcriptional regulator [Pseudohaliea rubra]|uniref:helix-turn-helix transcriptional regulator n=1 Tax=Pseudohaliea rubra TaxID=475795 RepID=UPI001378ACC0